MSEDGGEIRKKRKKKEKKKNDAPPVGPSSRGTTSKGEVSNEWYVGYDAVKDLLLRYAARDQSVLLLGCGTSTLGEDMAADGFARVAAVDYSEPCIAAMRRVQRARLDAAATADTAAAAADGAAADTTAGPSAKPAAPAPASAPSKPACEVDYRVMDVTAMAYPDDALDCVLDKATLDTMCQLDDDPTDHGEGIGRVDYTDRLGPLRPLRPPRPLRPLLPSTHVRIASFCLRARL